MRKAWITDRAKGKEIRGGYMVSLQDQIPGQDVTRQIAVEIKDSRPIRNDPPEDCHEQNVFNPWKEKLQQFHKGFIP